MVLYPRELVRQWHRLPLPFLAEEEIVFVLRLDEKGGMLNPFIYGCMMESKVESLPA